jgi:hypothetical protein
MGIALLQVALLRQPVSNKAKKEGCGTAAVYQQAAFAPVNSLLRCMVGHDFFRPYAMTFDFENMKIILSR